MLHKAVCEIEQMPASELVEWRALLLEAKPIDQEETRHRMIHETSP